MVMWRGARDGTTDKMGVHGVGLAIKKDLWDGGERGDKSVKCFGPRLMKVRLQLVRKPHGGTFAVA